MTNITSLLRSFRDGISLERQRVWWRMLWTFTAIKLTFFVVGLTFIWVALAHIAPDLFRGESAESMQSLVTSCVTALLMLQLADFNAGIAALGPYATQAVPRSYARLLVNVATARDMSLAHAISIEPGGDAASEPQTIGPLAHPMRALALSDGVYVFGVLAGVVVMCLGIAMTVATFFPPPPPMYHPATVVWIAWLSFPVILMLIGATGVRWALVARRFARMERQAFMAVVDADGVTFRLAGRAGYERRMRWNDASAFARIMHPDVMGRMHEVFVLSGAETDMLWEVMYTAPGAPAEEIQREEPMRVAAHRLAEQVALRTGLPLLDVSKTVYTGLGAIAGGPQQVAWSLFHLARKIAREQGDSAFAIEIDLRIGAGNVLLAKALARLGRRLPLPRSLTPAQRDETLHLARALLPYYPTPAQVTPNRRRRMLTQVYWNIELTLHMFIIIVLFVSPFVTHFFFS